MNTNTTLTSHEEEINVREGFGKLITHYGGLDKTQNLVTLPLIGIFMKKPGDNNMIRFYVHPGLGDGIQNIPMLESEDATLAEKYVQEETSNRWILIKVQFPEKGLEVFKPDDGRLPGSIVEIVWDSVFPLNPALPLPSAPL